ncbi:GlsB/YeaQ/YmgE family stress response membrane protein [Novosphingobium rosa]|uniref:GlsB/YeaQ/YmgE family stress response membrane protein n=1 Tax=Novosphingobium rosa TaxID=76978 RepID=UPI000834F8EB|nr:GlsB/YeaQ/YmgE family stress response membrane protein [Novosphingobium rosa]
MLRIIGALFSGFFIGLLARWLYPGAVHLGLIATILLGIGGSLLAELVARRQGSSQPVGCLASVLGAMALILLGRLLG